MTGSKPSKKQAAIVQAPFHCKQPTRCCGYPHVSIQKGLGAPWGPFFRISHSRFSLTFSVRSWDKFICSRVTGLVPALVSLLTADNFTQLRSVCSTRPSSLADKPIDFPSLPTLYMLDRPFIELDCVSLPWVLLHLLPPKSNVNCTSPLEDYLSGEPQYQHLLMPDVI